MKLEENLLVLLREKACCEAVCEVRSRVMVGYDGVTLMDVPAAAGRKNGRALSWLKGSTVVAAGRPNLRPWRLVAAVAEGKPNEVEEPDMSMDAAAEVVDAMAVAEAERWWLCTPS